MIGNIFVYILVAIILGSGLTMVLILVYDSLKYPLCEDCGHNAHTMRDSLFSKSFQCKIHGRQ